MGPSSNVNNFFGIKVSKAGVPVNNAADGQLTYKMDYNNGNQTFFADNGSIQFGVNTDGSLGLSVYNASNVLQFELNGSTWYWYDENGKNIMQVGLLPNGTYGWAVATPGNNVADSFA